MQQGRVVHYIPDKGFGFIEPDDRGHDVFFHVLDVAGETELHVGDRLMYDVRPGRDGRMRAVEVTRA